MKVKIFIYTIIIFLVILLQTTVINYLKISDIKPNLLIVFIVSIALLRGNKEGAAVGFFMGLSHDMVTGRVIGLHSLLGLYLGLIIGSVNRRLYRENFFVIIFFTFISTLIYEWMVYLLSRFKDVLDGQADMLFPLGSIIIPEAVYNSLISIFVFMIVIKLNDILKDIDKAVRKY